ncbi:diacylglycerol kinase family protein [Flammeovirgaceae bacterium SG7u.111]|nr:diacylglycerol kinase family protein [Flammeovirgaceae bacterium SG7u.132]WPO34103.1 diacylglycerol kinase family protein [Flammeovirgaceae bacterium SG7u.111]
MLAYLIKELKSFRHAFSGLKFLLSDHNFYFHLPVGGLVVIAGFFFGVSKFEWMWLVAAILSVWITEALNTAIEGIVDIVSPEFDPKAGRVKDIAAAAVFLSVVFAGIVGILVFSPYLIGWLGIGA